MGHKCYIRNVKGSFRVRDLLLSIWQQVWLLTSIGLPALWRRRALIREGQKTTTGLYRGWLNELDRPLSGDEDHIFYSYSARPAVRAPTN